VLRAGVRASHRRGRPGDGLEEHEVSHPTRDSAGAMSRCSARVDARAHLRAVL